MLINVVVTLETRGEVGDNEAAIVRNAGVEMVREEMNKAFSGHDVWGDYTCGRYIHGHHIVNLVKVREGQP